VSINSVVHRTPGIAPTSDALDEVSRDSQAHLKVVRLKFYQVCSPEPIFFVKKNPNKQLRKAEAHAREALRYYHCSCFEAIHLQLKRRTPCRTTMSSVIPRPMMPWLLRFWTWSSKRTTTGSMYFENHFWRTCLLTKI